MTNYILAIDLGTTSCKVALCSYQGKFAGFAREEISLAHPQPLWAEVEPATWWQTICRLIPLALQKAKAEPKQVEAIGLCGLMHALVAVDVSGKALTPSMLWMDGRCQPECQLLIENHGERIRELTGSLPRTTTSAAKLFWWKRHQPETVRSAHQFLLPKDFLRLKLTGEWATDPSDADGTALLSCNEKPNWSEEYLSQILDVPAEKLPRIQDSIQIAGSTTRQAAKALGLRRGIPVVTGSSDVRATLLGTNMYVSGRLCLYMGTAAWLAIGGGGEGNQMRPRFLGATATFGAAVRWCLQNLWQKNPNEKTYAQAEAEASKVAEGSDGLTFLPHLMGERGPYTNPLATGTCFGLTLSHRRAHLFRAILEGTAYQIRHLLEDRGAQEAAELWCVGGGVRSRLWLQILSDVIGVPIVIPRVYEAGLLGSAMMAAVGISRFPDLKSVAEAWVQPANRMKPQLKTVYEQAYWRYRKLDAAVQPFFEMRGL